MVRPSPRPSAALVPAAILAMIWPFSLFAETENAAVTVTTRPLSELIVRPELSATATVRSLNQSRISAQINARIEAIDVKVGDVVPNGNVLVELDCRDNELELARTKALRTLAQRQLSRARSLRTDANVSEELLNQREAEFAQAEADYGQATLNVERCRIRSPFKGVVLDRLASEGELADPGTSLIELLDMARLEVSAQVPTDLIETLTEAARVWFVQDGHRYPVTQRSLTPAVNPLARNREVRYVFNGEAPLPGAAGRLLWQDARLHLPADLVTRRSGRLGLFVAEGGKARFIPLPGALEGHPAPVDLPPETAVIIDGRFALSDGADVRLQDFQ